MGKNEEKQAKLIGKQYDDVMNRFQLEDSIVNRGLSVGKRMQEICMTKYPYSEEYIGELLILGLLHDIGLVTGKEDLNHEKEGGMFLRFIGYINWEVVYFHKWRISKRFHNNEMLDFLHIADMQIDENGNRRTATEGMAEYGMKYGLNSEDYREAVELYNYLLDKYPEDMD